MKLQLSPDTLRLRLASAELAEFSQTGQLTQVLDLGAGPAFTYALHRLPTTAPGEPAAPAGGLRVRYAASALVVEVPAMLAQSLTEGTTVSLRGEARGTNGQLLRILVEQDLGPSH